MSLGIQPSVKGPVAEITARRRVHSPFQALLLECPPRQPFEHRQSGSATPVVSGTRGRPLKLSLQRPAWHFQALHRRRRFVRILLSSFRGLRLGKRPTFALHGLAFLQRIRLQRFLRARALEGLLQHSHSRFASRTTHYRSSKQHIISLSGVLFR